MSDGIPNMRRLGKVNIGENVLEQLKLDLEVEKTAIRVFNEGIELCRSLGDNGSRELLEEMLVSEEGHANWLEAQLSLVTQTGEPNYLAQQIKED